jgi:hypothetical protein
LVDRHLVRIRAAALTTSALALGIRAQQRRSPGPRANPQPLGHRGVSEQVSICAAANIEAMMRRALPMACALALGAVGGVLLDGCGGGTKTVTVPGAPAATAGARVGAHTSSTASTAPTASTPARTTTATPTTTGTSSTGEQPTSTTRTAPAPAFVHTGGTTEQAASTEAKAAAAVVSAHGYTAENLSDYRGNQTLRVLIGTRTGAADPYNERAFFFLGSHYLGTDSATPSASVNVAGQSDTEIVLTYALYRAHDSLCCPSGGSATVHFQLNNGQLVPLQPIPPASSPTGLSRQ